MAMSSCFAFVPIGWKASSAYRLKMERWTFTSVVPSPREGFQCFRVPLTEARGYWRLLSIFSRSPFEFCYWDKGTLTPFARGDGVAAQRRNLVKAVYDANRDVLHWMGTQKLALQFFLDLGVGLTAIEKISGSSIADLYLIGKDGKLIPSCLCDERTRISWTLLCIMPALATQDGKPTQTQLYAAQLHKELASKAPKDFVEPSKEAKAHGGTGFNADTHLSLIPPIVAVSLETLENADKALGESKVVSEYPVSK